MKTKSLTSESESKIQNRDVDAPPRKKLKQARLPFQILTPSVESPLPPFKNNNKRKLETSDDVQIVKVVRPNESNELETKENVCSASVPSDCKKSTDIQTTKDVGGIDDTSKKSSEDEGNSNNIQKPEAGDKLENINSIQKPEAGDKLENKVDEIIEDNKLEKCKENSKVTNIENKCKGKEIPNKEVDIITVTDNEDSVSSPVNNKDIILSEKQKHLDKNAMVKNHTEDTTTLCVSLTDSEDSETEECEEISATMDDKANCHTENSDADESSTDDSPSPDLKSDKSDLTCHKTDNSDHTVSDAGKSVELSNEHSSDVHSLESTPIRRRSTEKVSPNPSLGSAQKFRKLTPKQLLKQAESAKKREEKERQKQEREKKRAEEKEEREKKKAEEKEEKLRQKQEKEEQKKKEKEEKEEQKRKEKEEKEEQKRKEKEEKEEQKKKEKEEKERKKQIELEMKNEEKRKKEEKKQAEVAAFTSFFVPKKAESKAIEEPKPKAEENFMPFEVKADMRLAPSKRTILTSELRKTLDKALEIQDQGKLYLEQLKNKEINPQSTTTTWALSDFKNDVVILEEDEITDNVADSVIEPYPATGQTHRPKLLQFWENRRPPYWGTWRKKSKSITAIKPFNKDEKYFDYEVDSDDEWEEEEPGESLHGSDDEKESEDEYEVDNEFFVPHGYLSEEENEEDEEVQSPERMKTKLKLLELEFEEEMKQKTERLKPRIIGCIWINPSNVDAVGSQLLTLLSRYQAVYQDFPVTFAPDSEAISGSPDLKNNSSSQATLTSKRKKFPEEGIPALIKLIHGNNNRREFLVKEFIAYWNKEQQKQQGDKTEEDSETNTPVTPGDIVKRSVSVKIKELATWVACPDEGSMHGRMCWYVPSEIREAYGLSELTLPNTSWTYTFKPKRRESDIPATCISPVSNAEASPKQLITKFTKVMTEVERKKQFTPKTSEGTESKSGESTPAHPKSQKKLFMNSFIKGNSSSNSNEHQKKVPVVTSVLKGQEVPKCVNSLMKFVKPQGGGSKEEKNISKTDDKGNENIKGADSEECIVLD